MRSERGSDDVIVPTSRGQTIDIVVVERRWEGYRVGAAALVSTGIFGALSSALFMGLGNQEPWTVGLFVGALSMIAGGAVMIALAPNSIKASVAF